MTLTLNARPRVLATRAGLKNLRKDDMIPAVVYSRGKETAILSLSYREFEKLYQEAGTSNLVDLVIDGASKSVPVLIAEVQRDPIDGAVLHVDLREVNMTEKLRTQVQLVFIGESPAVKTLGGNLNINIDALNVECLPNDLVSSIEVDISSLAELDASLHVSDIAVPAGITVLDDPAGSIVSVLAPRAEEERPQADAAPTIESADTAAQTSETTEKK